jgi:hypothetical protein
MIAKYAMRGILVERMPLDSQVPFGRVKAVEEARAFERAF